MLVNGSSLHIQIHTFMQITLGEGTVLRFWRCTFQNVVPNFVLPMGFSIGFWGSSATSSSSANNATTWNENPTPETERKKSHEPSHLHYVHLSWVSTSIVFGGGRSTFLGSNLTRPKEFLSLQDRFMTIFKPRKGMQHWLIAILLLSTFPGLRFDTMAGQKMVRPISPFPRLKNWQPTSAPLLRALALPALRKNQWIPCRLRLASLHKSEYTVT